MKHLLVLIVVAGSVLANSQANQKNVTGHIKGTVADQNGMPVSDATVYAIPQDITFESATPQTTKSDRKGEFDFRDGLDLGMYKLYVRKDADAYPDRSDRFYADSKIEPPKVELTEDHPLATVSLILGEKAGILVGRVVDANTGTTLSAKLVFMDEDGNNHSVIANGKYRSLIPAGKEVTVMVIGMSPEYGSQLPVVPLRLVPGQEMQMDIPLYKR